MLSDSMKTTIKETTSHDQILGGQSEYKSGFSMPTDFMKPTIKQTTIYQMPGKNPTGEVNQSYTRDENDSARVTIRETTEKTLYDGPIGKADNRHGYTRDINDNARVTIKESTIINKYGNGSIRGNVDKQISHDAANNMTMLDKREIGTYNRSANGGANLAGPQINKNNIQMNCKKSSIYYVSHPVKKLDQNITPSNTTPYKDGTFVNLKPQLNYGNYSTDNSFISALKDNPLVNDIFHPK
jgi:hypothetical protein